MSTVIILRIQITVQFLHHRFFKSLKDNLLEPEVFHINPKKSDTRFFRKFTSLFPASVSWYGAYLLKVSS